MKNLRLKAGSEEIDYLQLKSLLHEYARPRDKIRQLLKSGILIRVKKGLYVFGANDALFPCSKEILANWIYGPSCISLEYALAYYGLIPERAEIVTSITCKRNKFFHTPLGDFLYKYIHPKRYAVQIQRILLHDERSILIASPEKALADKLISTQKLNLLSQEDLLSYLLSDLRMDTTKLFALRKSSLEQIAKIYQHVHIDLLLECRKKWGNR